MTCADARAAVLAGTAGPSERAHIASCFRCQTAVGRLAAFGGMLSDPAVWVEPPEELAERVAASIRPAGPAPSRRRGIVAAAVAAVLTTAVAFGLLLRPEPPDWELEMAGTGSAPGAVALVAGWTGESGSRMRLTVDGLDPAPSGTVYELWLSSDDVHVSAGTFVDPTDVELTAGVARRDFPRLWVTVEPLDGDPSPSGDTVLDTPG